jgi:methylene-fatty-acyl-phospholipid synthase
MSRLAWALKLVQFSSMAALSELPKLQANLRRPELALPALLLAGAGQTLNALVYKHLGHDGVYYGFKFGKKVPWVTAFPYSHMRDPQYIGTLLSLAAAWTIGFPVELCSWWALNYFYLM